MRKSKKYIYLNICVSSAIIVMLIAITLFFNEYNNINRRADEIKIDRQIERKIVMNYDDVRKISQSMHMQLDAFLSSPSNVNNLKTKQFMQKLFSSTYDPLEQENGGNKSKEGYSYELNAISAKFVEKDKKELISRVTIKYKDKDTYTKYVVFILDDKDKILGGDYIEQ
ncbi:hypothetical protein [Listeria welshimeri]|uniref:hypothetical protein n=1 Tax=Listeria welshimeri TaxID=1643 RepID=UPI001629B888|nr:hypothetical protein [Listeria welshimeri]MBC1342372.1 hypothetical protein [Listeria welshimeri]MBF2342570.1 hypothetical protein [Listeria welshimeri]